MYPNSGVLIKLYLKGMSFETDLKKGKEWEHIIAKCLNSRGFDIEVLEGKNNFDLIDRNTDLKFEVKADIGSKETNNVAVEIGTPSDPRGLSTSLATYWVHIWYMGETVKYNLLPVWSFKRLIKNNKDDIKIIHKVGDGNSTVCLIPKELFKEWHVCKDIDVKYLKPKASA